MNQHSPAPWSSSTAWRNGLSVLAIRLDPRAIDLIVDDAALHFILADSREISAPLAWFPRLMDATQEQRQRWRLIGKGVGVY